MAKFPSFLLALASHVLLTSAALPWALPFFTIGDEQIYSAEDEIVQYVGTNWPGHQELMIPEGLQYSSVGDIVTEIKQMGLNVVRLTFAIAMIDDILDNGGDVRLETSLTNALGTTDGPKVLDQILAHNPSFNENTTRLQVFDAVAAELAAQDIYVHLDNHMSKATWCCSNNDGNAWFGDKYFDIQKWTRGWEYMATHASNWTSLASIGLRNELRSITSGGGEPYDWYTWYVHMTNTATVVHKAAPDVLIFFGGLDYDTTIEVIPTGTTLNGTLGTVTEGKTAVFNPFEFEYWNKIVLELHRYDHGGARDSCDSVESFLLGKGYSSITNTTATKFKFPVVLTEWGLAMDAATYNQTTYVKCLTEFMEKYKPSGWIQWTVSGSYYMRRGTLDDDEPWALLNHNWTALRDQTAVHNTVQPMIMATLRTQ